MKQSVTERLRKLGLDVDFLAWLEGDEQRLPELDPIRKIKDADFAAAIRAAAWLGDLFSDEQVVAPDKAEQWLARYKRLEMYLDSALKATVFYRVMSTATDLSKLEKVLEILLPPELWDEYQKDIGHTRRQGLPPAIPETKAKRSGGIREKEQTTRMRAAVSYISRRSETPYADLARLWNEHLGVEKYTHELIKDRLRKGRALSSDSAAQRSLQSWMRVYHGDLRHVFPGPFPLSPKLRQAYWRKLLRSKRPSALSVGK